MTRQLGSGTRAKHLTQLLWVGAVTQRDRLPQGRPAITSRNAWLLPSYSASSWAHRSHAWEVSEGGSSAGVPAAYVRNEDAVLGWRFRPAPPGRLWASGKGILARQISLALCLCVRVSPFLAITRPKKIIKKTKKHRNLATQTQPVYSILGVLLLC